MFDKPLASLTLDDITQLIEVVKEPEGQFVDYKQLLGTDAGAKKELIKDVSAFANAQGGYLVIGVSEEDGLPKAITGTPKSVGRQKIDEWINTVLSAGADPKIHYSIKVITIKDGLVVVVLHIKDSPQKPHMMTLEKRNTYFKRHLDITSAATNQEVRDMFAESQASSDRLRDFLDSKRLLDINFGHFGLTNNARRLVNNNAERDADGRGITACIISLIPSTLTDNLIDPVSGAAREWLNNNTNGYQPIPSKDLYRTHEQEIDIDGVTFANQIYSREGPEGFRRYVEFLNNGYVELGISSDVFYKVNAGEGRKPVMHLTNIVALAHAMINFANKYYPAINSEDKVYLQLSLRNIKGYALSGFDERPINGNGGWAPAYSVWNENPPVVKNYSNVRVVRLISPSGSNEPTVDDQIYGIASELSRAFGVQEIKCFDAAKTYNAALLQHLFN
jgi:hypothetical protein